MLFYFVLRNALACVAEGSFGKSAPGSFPAGVREWIGLQGSCKLVFPHVPVYYGYLFYSFILVEGSAARTIRESGPYPYPGPTRPAGTLPNYDYLNFEFDLIISPSFLAVHRIAALKVSR
jgi:hypothetical protein